MSENNQYVLELEKVSKTYKGGFKALSEIDLKIRSGEIFALLGPNGAGKTTLIGSICSIVNLSSGKITVDGLDHRKDFRKVRQKIGLVPQEITNDAFTKVIDAVRFSRGLFGLPPNDEYLLEILKDLSLYEKRNSKMLQLSGGMKRRVMIAKALAHEPTILFLDEPTAGVDVTLRESMWRSVEKLRQSGVTVILTTHYIEEAELMADRIGVIDSGKIIMVERTDEMIKKMGKKKLILTLNKKIEKLPEKLRGLDIDIEGCDVVYTFDANSKDKQLAYVISSIKDTGASFVDIQTKQSSLEQIFVELVGK